MRSEAGLPVPAPSPTAETAEFWAATARGTLLLPRCDECSTVIWYPRVFCPACGSQTVSWIEASGRGIIYSFTVARRGMGPYKDAAPYAVAYVELEEGPRIMTNVVDDDPGSLEVGMPVQVVFHDTGEGSALYRFRRAGGGDR